MLRADGSLTGLAVEFKVPRYGTKGPGLTDNYLIQLQLTLACTRSRAVDFATLRMRRDSNGREVRELAVTRVDRDEWLLSVLMEQLLAFWEEAARDDEPYDRSNLEGVELRLALADARIESVGDERVYAME